MAARTRRAPLPRLISIAICVLLLAGCSSAAGDGAIRGGRQAFSGTKLRVLLKEGYEIDAIKRFLPEFERATGIDVRLEVYDEPTARSKFVLDAISKTGTYDVTSASFWNLPEFVRPQWLQPLDDYIERAHDPWLNLDDIPEGARKSMTIDGQLYAIPHTIISGLFYYRKDILAKHGIDPPETTAEILAAARRLAREEPDMVPFAARGAASFASLGTDLGWAYGYGALLFDEEGQPHADDPKMRQAMQDFVTLIRDYGPDDAASLTFTQAGESFSSGRAAMIFETSGFGTIFENPKLSKVAGKIGYTLPKGPDGKTLQWLYNEGLAIPAESRNKNAAWLFLQWRVSRQTTMKELLELGRTDVPNLHVLGSPEYKRYAREHNVEAFTSILPASWASATTEHWPFSPQFAQIGDIFSAEISGAIAGSKDVPAALSSAQDQLERITVSAR
jgi:ABC-type glycerol-3-phosphate transport system substrate-binding protein